MPGSDAPRRVTGARPELAGDGVEALLARTRRQVSRFTLAAIVVVVSLVLTVVLNLLAYFRR